MQAKVHTASIDVCFMYNGTRLERPGISNYINLRNSVHFHAPFFTNHVYFTPHHRPPLLKGHRHGWSLYRGSNISVSVIKIRFMTWRMNCRLNSRNSIINTYGYSITICNFQHCWSSDCLIFHYGVIIFISASIFNAFLHWLWFLHYYHPR